MKKLLPTVIVAFYGLCVPAWAALPGEVPDGGLLPSLAPMLEQVSPAVVNIATYTTVQVRNPLLEDPFFRRRGECRQRLHHHQLSRGGQGR